MNPADIKLDVQSGAAPQGAVPVHGDIQANFALGVIPQLAKKPATDSEDYAQLRGALAYLQQTYALIKIGDKIWVHDQQGSVALGRLGTTQKLVFYNRGDASLLIARTLHKERPSVDTGKVLKVFLSILIRSAMTAWSSTRQVQRQVF